MSKENEKVEMEEKGLCPCWENCPYVNQVEEDTEKFYNNLVNMNSCLNIMEHYIDSMTFILKNSIYEIQEWIEKSFDTMFPGYSVSEIPAQLQNPYEDAEEKEDWESDFVGPDRQEEKSSAEPKTYRDYLEKICDAMLDEVKKSRLILV